jgi:hypothetical protein
MKSGRKTRDEKCTKTVTTQAGLEADLPDRHWQSSAPILFAVQDVRLRQGIEQSVGGGAVCKLSTGQEKSEWSAGNIKQRMNFRGATAVTVLRSPSSANEASACSGMMRTLGALDADPEGRTAPGCD